MANSSTVSSGDLATATQYNNLRSDVIDTSTGHVHDGTNGRGDAQTILQVAGSPLVVENSTDATSNQVLLLRGANDTRATNDEIYISFHLDDAAGNTTEFGRMTVKAIDVTNTSEDGQIEFDVMKAGTLTNVWTLTSSSGAAMSYDLNVDSVTFGTATDGTDISLTFDGHAGDGVITWMEDEDYFQFSDDIFMSGTEKIVFNDAGEYISGDGTDLTIVSSADLNLTATSDINIPQDVGLTFGNDAEKIEGDGTDLTIAGNNINLTATADVVIPANVGITFGSGEKIEGDSTDLTITSGAKINLTATSDVVVPANVGITFGSGEKIEGDNTDLTVTSGAKINLTATSDVVIPANIGLTFGTGEKIEGDNTDLTVTSGADINLTATGDVNIPQDVGITFGDNAEKLEGDGTDLTISGNNINLTASADIVVPANIGITFGSGEKIEGDNTNLTVTSGADINLTATGDINIPQDIGITFGDDAEKIEGDGTDLTISGNNINLTAAADVLIPADIGLFFGNGESIEGDNTDLTVTSGAKLNLTATSDVHIPKNVGIVFDDNASEKIESNNTDLTINSGADINLTATGDINIPQNIGLTFGNDAEKIEGDGTDLTITGNNINLTATADVVIPANVGITFGTGEKIEGDSTDLTITSGADIVLAATADINVPQDIGITFGNDGEKIEGDGTNLSIASSGTLTETGTTITLDSGGDVVLSAAGGQVTVDDGTTTIFTFDAAEPSITISDDADTGDLFKIAVGAAGATTFTTVDDNTDPVPTSLAHMTIRPDGYLIVQQDSATMDATLDNVSLIVKDFDSVGNNAIAMASKGAGTKPSIFLGTGNNTAHMMLSTGARMQASVWTGGGIPPDNTNATIMESTASTAAIYRHWYGAHYFFGNAGLTAHDGGDPNEYAPTLLATITPSGGGDNTALTPDLPAVSGALGIAGGIFVGQADLGTYALFGNSSLALQNCLLDDAAHGDVSVNGGSTTLYIGLDTIDVTTPSDATLKENIEDTSIDSLSILDQLQLRDFNWKSNHPNYGQQTERQFGMVAQEVEEVLPHIVRQDEDGIRNVQYNKMIPYLVKAIQELNQELQEIKGGS